MSSEELTPEQLDDLRYGAAPAHGATPTQPERDLAATVMDLARIRQQTREHLLARITDLEDQRIRRQQDTLVLLQREQFQLAAEHMQAASSAGQTLRELRRVLELLQ